MFKKFFFWTILLFFYFCLIVAAGEIYARVKHGDTLAMKSQIASYRRADFKFHHSFIPDSRGPSISKEWDVVYDINSFGLRDREYPVKKGDNVFRILALGDSFTEGHGVAIEQTFVKILEEKLNESFVDDVKYEVIIAGIGGYSPILEYLFLSDKGLRFNPDLVVLFYDFNDLKDDRDLEITTVFDEKGLPLRCFPYKRIRAYGFNPLERFLIKHSRYYLYLENRINKKLFKLRHKDIKFEEEVDAFIAFREGEDQLVRKLWEKNEKYLGLIHEILRKKGIPFVIASYPYAIEVSSVEWSEGRAARDLGIEKVYGQPQVIDFLRRFADDRGIFFINVYDDFKKSRVFPLYFKFDGHFNKNGHALMAEALFPKFLDIIASFREEE